MPTAKQRANWARFAKMARARARAKSSRRKASRSTRRATKARRVYSKRSTTMARRTRRGRKGGRKSKASIADVLVGINATGQLAEPMLPAIGAALAGDYPGALSAARAGAKEAASFRNIGQAAAPAAAVWAAKKVGLGRMLKFKVLGRRLI